jgi:hypothetical protein
VAIGVVCLRWWLGRTGGGTRSKVRGTRAKKGSSGEAQFRAGVEELAAVHTSPWVGFSHHGSLVCASLSNHHAPSIMLHLNNGCGCAQKSYRLRPAMVAAVWGTSPPPC